MPATTCCRLRGELPLKILLPKSSFTAYSSLAIRFEVADSHSQQVVRYDALRLLLLGYPQQALETIEEVLARAHQLQRPFDLGIALLWATQVRLIRGEPLLTIELATALAAVGKEHGFVFLETIAGAFRGWSLCERGEVETGIAEFQEGLAAFRATGTEAYGAFLEVLLVETLARAGKLAEGTKVIDQAISFAESKDERFYEPELYRLNGELLQSAGANADEVTSWFQRAIETARRHGTKYLELRAVMSLARLLQQLGENTEAQQMLSEIYSWFTEGFDTRDLKEAKALLDELRMG